MDICVITKKGKNKSENEDRVLINKSILSDGCFFITGYDIKNTSVVIAIADGVGGNNAGAEASHYIVNYLSGLRVGDPEQVKAYIKSGNLELIGRSKANPDLRGMATTLSGLIVKDDTAVMFHIGNTRIFTSSNKYLKQITTDHTTVNYLLKTGKLTEEEAVNYNKRNEITACLGADNEKLADSLIVDYVPNFKNITKIIMTSDGIHEYVSLDDMENILDLDIGNMEKCNMIIDKAVQNGSTDDISVVLSIRRLWSVE